MKNDLKVNSIKLTLLLKVIIVISLVVGIFCRFYFIDQKALSNDETFSSTYIYGHQLASIIDRKIVTVQELQTYQTVNPQESLADSLTRIITEPYVFPPLYGILMQFWSRFWLNIFQDPAIISRSLSAFLSLFSLWGMYWLCQELFHSTAIAWIGTALIAISPFHFQYSQIVRTYSLTTALTLISSAALLHAIKAKTWSSWAVYALTVTIGLYSNLLFGFVGIAHLIFILWREKLQFKNLFRAYFLASLVGGVIFLPWFILFITSPSLLGYSVAQVNVKSSPLNLIKIWIRNFKPIFIDVNNPWVEFTNNFSSISKLAFVFVFFLLIAALYYVIRYGQKEIKIFLFSLILGGGGLLMIKDLTLGGTFSTRLRYLIPYVLGIELLVIYFLTAQLTQRIAWKKNLATVAISVLLIGGTLSCGIISIADSWVAFGSAEFPLAAREINKTERPIIIFEDFGDALTMSYLLKPQANAHLTRNVNAFFQNSTDNIYQDFSDIFIFKPAVETKATLNQNSSLSLKLIQQPTAAQQRVPKVWRIKFQ